MKNGQSLFVGACMFGCAALWASPAALALPFDGAVATYEQSAPNGPWSAALAIDGNTSGVWDYVHPNGWGVYNVGLTGDQTLPQTAYFRLTNPISLTHITDGVQIGMYFNFDVNPYHTLGDFRISVTTADLHSTTFNLADAQADPWTAVAPSSFVITPSSGPSPSYSVDGSDAIFVGGPPPPQALYTLTFAPGIMNITGIRLEALANPALPYNGPGYGPADGNFTLNEITAQAVTGVPEPGSIALLALGSVGLLVRRRAR